MLGSITYHRVGKRQETGRESSCFVIVTLLLAKHNDDDGIV